MPSDSGSADAQVQVRDEQREQGKIDDADGQSQHGADARRQHRDEQQEQRQRAGEMRRHHAADEVTEASAAEHDQQGSDRRPRGEASPRINAREPVERLALSPSACRGLTFSNRTSGIASAQRARVRAEQPAEADGEDADDSGGGPELRRMLREVVVDVVLAQQREIDEAAPRAGTARGPRGPSRTMRMPSGATP